MNQQSLPAPLAPLASLRLTVTVLVLSMLLIFFGTLAQATRGIWWVMDIYFTSWTVAVPLAIFSPPERPLPGSFPFPGGATLGLILLVNLLAAHYERYKISARGAQRGWGTLLLLAGVGCIAVFHQSPLAGHLTMTYGLAVMLGVGALMYVPSILGTAVLFGRRVGIVLIHVSLILLIVGEGVTRVMAVEASMPIYEGESIDWVMDMRTTELAVIDSSDPQRDRVTVVPESKLIDAFLSDELITHPDLPFDVRVDAFYTNSTFRRRGEAIEPARAEMKGLASQFVLEPLAEVSGVGGQMYNLPGAQVTLLRDGTPIGLYTLSAVTTFIGESYKTIPQNVFLDDGTYAIDLRFERHHKPYTFELLDFHHDLYPGTQVPKNFASDIRLTDPTSGEDREIKISMNQPLRYDGYTFFQAGYIQGDAGTVLQVVNNPGWTMPYIACTLGGAGLTIHFFLSLSKFLRRRTV
jgi:hypothetical protein